MCGDAHIPAATAFAQAGLQPIVLGAKEGLALLNGTQFSTAYALAGLFEAEALLRIGLVTGALSTDAARGSDAPFDPRIHALRGHRGQIDAAHALRALLAGSAIRASHLTGDDRVQDPVLYALSAAGHGRRTGHSAQHCCNVGGRGQRRIRQPTDLRGPTGGAVGRQFPRRARRLCRRHHRAGPVRDRRAGRATHCHAIDPSLSRLPAFLTPKPGLNSGFMVPQVTAAALVAETPARDAGEHRFDPDVRQSGGPRIDVGPCGTPAAADGRQRCGHPWHRAPGRGAGLRLPRAAHVQPAARTRSRAGTRAGAAPGRGPRIRIRILPRQ